MTTHIDQAFRNSATQRLHVSIDVLKQSVQGIDRRRAELLLLTEEFQTALEIVSDLKRVNRSISLSNRPDLQITEPAKHLQIDDLDDLGRLNNFKTRARGFGPPIFSEEEGRGPDINSRKIFIGRRIPTRQELESYFSISSRGDYDSGLKFGANSASHGMYNGKA